MVTRLPDWRQRLVRYLAAEQAAPFSYGSHDCALLAAGAVEAVTGVDPAAEWRGTYTSLAGGLRAIRAAGYADLVDVVDSLFERVEPRSALPGDVAAVDTPDGPALGVVVGPAVRVRRPEGLGTVHLSEATIAWRVSR